MVHEHLRCPYRFVCVTNSPDGLDGIETVPLWEDLADLPGCWRRLKVFAPEMRDLLGERILSIDLDSVVTGDLTPLVDRPEDFVILQDWSPRALYNGSLFLLTTGSRVSVWEDFQGQASIAACRKAKWIGTDQAWLALHFGPGEATWESERHGIYSYRWQIAGDGEAQLPRGCRVVFFHGPFDPSMETIRKRSPWIEDYWRCR